MSADRLDEVKARAEQVHWTSTSIEQAMARLASSAADVPWLVSEVERLTRVIDAKPRQPLVVLNEYLDRAEKAETEVRRLTALVQSTENKADGYLAEIESAHAERDALVARVAEAVHLTDVWVSDLATDAMVNAMDPEALEAINEQMKRLLDLRDALAGSGTDTSDTQPTDQDATGADQ